MSREAYELVEVIWEEIEHVGIWEVARRSGLREDFIRQAFRSGSESCPNLVTVVTVAEVLGMRIMVSRR